MFLCLLSQSLEMSNVGAKSLEKSILVVVPHAKLLARFTDNRSYFWIVNLTHAWEQVMSSLMVQSTWKIGIQEYRHQQPNCYYQDYVIKLADNLRLKCSYLAGVSKCCQTWVSCV